MRPAYWAPPVAWMMVLLWLSSDTWSAEHTEWWLLPLFRWLLPWATPAQLDAVHVLTRKAAHVSEYAILAALWFRAFRRGRGLGGRASSWLALLLSVGWAFVDELRQSIVLSRTGSAADVVLDAAGALAALALARRGWRGSVDGATAALLWLAAGGGAAILAIDAWAGVPSGPLWASVPVALLLLLARARLRRRSATAGSGDAGARDATRDP